MSNILFLSHRIPYPPNKGDKIRSFNLIRYLNQRHKVYLAALATFEEPQDLTPLQAYCFELEVVRSGSPVLAAVKSFLTGSSVSVVYFYRPVLQHFVDRVLQTGRIDVVLCYCAPMAEYIFRSQIFRSLNHKPKLLMDFVDLDSDKWRQYAEHDTFPKSLVYQRERRHLTRYEDKIGREFDACFFASPREVSLYRNQTENLRQPPRTISNGLDSDFFSRKPKQPEQDTPLLLFTGVMDYFANIEGVLWFTNDIWPTIRQALPGVRFCIAGMRPVKSIQKLAGKHPDIEVTGFVSDMREYYHKADVYVAPLRIARGVQNKVLEAMATGNAVVTTSQVSAGIRCKNGEDILVADTETDFAQQVINLLRDKQLRDRIADAAVKTIHRHYNWSENLKQLDTLLSETVAESSFLKKERI